MHSKIWKYPWEKKNNLYNISVLFLFRKVKEAHAPTKNRFSLFMLKDPNSLDYCWFACRFICHFSIIWTVLCKARHRAVCIFVVCVHDVCRSKCYDVDPTVMKSCTKNESFLYNLEWSYVCVCVWETENVYTWLVSRCMYRNKLN